MRIAVVHSYYSAKQPSGENIAVDAQVKVLREAGHQVLLVAQHTDDRERSRTYPLEAAWTVATGRGRSPLGALEDFLPDVVHVHNLFPNWGTRWLDEWSGPIVATLHNFRPMCAAGTLYRDGQTCTLCPDGHPWAGLKHRCYRGSAVATAPLAWSGRSGAAVSSLAARPEELVVLSERSRTIYERSGVARNRISVVPNFLEDPYCGGPQTEERHARWVFVGRLTPEKGVLELLDRWPQERQLDVIGDGPLIAAARNRAGRNVHFMGAIDHDRAVSLLPRYQGMVFPSRCIEGAAPLVVLEALAAGLPVAALEGSSGADLVTESGAGRVVTNDDGWPEAIREIEACTEELGAMARATYEAHFHPTTWIQAIGEIYSSATAAATEQ